MEKYFTLLKCLMNIVYSCTMVTHVNCGMPKQMNTNLDSYEIYLREMKQEWDNFYKKNIFHLINSTHFSIQIKRIICLAISETKNKY